MPFQEWTETIRSSLSEVVVFMGIAAHRHEINHLVTVIVYGRSRNSTRRRQTPKCSIIGPKSQEPGPRQLRFLLLKVS